MRQRRIVGVSGTNLEALLDTINKYIEELETEFQVTSVQISPYKNGRRVEAVVIVELEW